MDTKEAQLQAIKKMRDRNDPSFQDYAKVTSAEMLPFGDQVAGVAGGAGASLGRFVGGLQEGEDLSTALREGKDAFSEGREDSLKGMEESRGRIPQEHQNTLMAGSMLMPGGLLKGGKALKVLDKASDAGKLAMAAPKIKRMQNLKNIMRAQDLNKYGKASEMLGKGKVVPKEKVLNSLADKFGDSIPKDALENLLKSIKDSGAVIK